MTSCGLFTVDYTKYKSDNRETRRRKEPGIILNSQVGRLSLTQKNWQIWLSSVVHYLIGYNFISRGFAEGVFLIKDQAVKTPPRHSMIDSPGYIGIQYKLTMAIKLKHSNTFSTYFVTFTCVNWISLFEITNTYDAVYKWFDVLKEKYEADIVAYAIMPNHLHIIIHFHKENFNLNTIIGNGKRFLAYEIVHRLEIAEKKDMLNLLRSFLKDREKKKGQVHKIFKDSFDAKAIFSHQFLLQKINYIHDNPVSGKWMLAKDFVEYEHSSASFYETEFVRHFRPLHFLDL